MYFKDLTKKEKRHLAENGITTLQRFKAVATNQKEKRDKPDFQQCNEPCYECKNIARKLGLPI